MRIRHRGIAGSWAGCLPVLWLLLSLTGLLLLLLLLLLLIEKLRRLKVSQSVATSYRSEKRRILDQVQDAWHSSVSISLLIR